MYDTAFICLPISTCQTKTSYNQVERCQTGERQLGEWILADGRMEKTGHGQMVEWYDHLSNISSRSQ